MSLKKIKTQGSQIILGIFLMVVFNACSRTAATYYHPNEASMLVVSEKGDLKVAGDYNVRETNYYGESSTRKTKQYNIQLAYSPINRVVVTGSYYKNKAKSTILPISETVNHKEISVGFYNKFGMVKETDKSFFLPDLHIGIGSGNISNQFETAGIASLKYRRYFLHSGVHFGWKDNLNFGIGVRYVHLRFQSADLISKIPEFYESGFSIIENKAQRNFMETSCQVQAGVSILKVYLRATGVLASLNGSTPLGRSHASVGLILELDEIWKKAF